MEECRNCKHWGNPKNKVGSCIFLKASLMQRNTFPNKEINNISVNTNCDFWCNNFKLKVDCKTATKVLSHNN